MVTAAVFGLLFQSLLSYFFGAGAETDAFFMSVSIFALLSKFLMFGQLKSIALPVYGRLEEDGEVVLGGLLKAAAVALGAMALFAAVAAPVLVRVLAPGFDAPTRELTTTLLRIRVPALMIVGFVTLARVGLESRGEFGLAVFVQRVVPAVLSFVLLLWLGETAEISHVAWIALTATASGAMLLVLVRPRLLRGRVRSAVRSPDLRGVLRSWLRFSQSTTATFLGEWAFRVGASLLPVGGFSAVLYGRMVHDVAHGAINDPATTVTLPEVARAVEAEGPSAAGRLLRRRLISLTMLTAPLAALLALLAPWIVAILFGRGRFLADGMVDATALALSIFAVGFLVQGLNQILFTGAYAVGASHLVNRVNLVGHLMRALGLIPLVWLFGLVGLVGAQVGMNVLVLVLVVRGWPPEFELRSGAGAGALWRALGSIAIACIAAGLIVVWALSGVGDPLAYGLAGRLGVAVGAAAGFLVVFSGLAEVFGLPIRDALAAVLRQAGLRGMDPAASGEDSSS